SRPGLQPQHLMSVRSAARVGSAHVVGASLQSTDLQFTPGPVAAGKYRFDIGTAGATGLVLHTLYLPLALPGKTPSELTLTGGTPVTTSPCYHFLAATWRPYLARLGLTVALSLVRPGFYPRGGGEVRAVIEPCPGLKPLRLTERGPVGVKVVSAAAGLPEHVANRQARRAAHTLRQRHGIKAEVKEGTWRGGPGSMLAVVLDTKPVPTLFFSLGARGKPAEKVADEATAEAGAYFRTVPAAVDPHSADQLVLPLALTAGPSEYSVSAVTQ